MAASRRSTSCAIRTSCGTWRHRSTDAEPFLPGSLSTATRCHVGNMTFAACVRAGKLTSTETGRRPGESRFELAGDNVGTVAGDNTGADGRDAAGGATGHGGGAAGRTEGTGTASPGRQ